MQFLAPFARCDWLGPNLTPESVLNRLRNTLWGLLEDIVHLDINTTADYTVRVSVSNLYHANRTIGSRIIQVGFQPLYKWTMLALDLPALVAPSTYVSIKSIQFCAHVHVRNVFTSNRVYSWTNLPQDMVLMSIDKLMIECLPSSYDA